jgi:hypothetical protein
MAQVLVAIESNKVQMGTIEHKSDRNDGNWKETGPFGHKLASVLIQLSSNGVSSQILWFGKWKVTGLIILWGFE